MSCPDRDILYRFCDDDLEGSARRDVEDHVEGCEACEALVAQERAFARKLGELACPDPETLARFIDDALPPEALERVAAHVLECEPCRDVVAWTREGQQQVKIATARRRRRPLRARPRTGSGVPTWAPLAAAAALFFVLTLWVISRPNQPLDIADHGPDPVLDTPPEVPQDTDPQDLPETTPDVPETTPDVPETTLDVPETTPDVPETTPERTPDVPEATPDVPDASGPDEGTRTDPKPERRSAGPVIALAGGSLRWRGGDDVESPLSGTTALRSDDIIIGGRDGGGFQLGSTVLTLAANASVRLSALRESDGGPGRVTLLEGEALVESDDAGQELALGDAIVRPADDGGRMLLAKSPEFFSLCVVEGGADVQVMGQAAVRLGPGEGRRVEQGTLKPAGRDLSGLLRRASQIGSRADARRAVPAPRGFLALRGLRALPEDGALAPAAAAVLAVDALGLDPALANLPAHVRGLSASTADRRQQLADADPEVLAAAGAASPALLSLLCREGKRPGPEAKARARELAAAIAARPANELASDGLALLALRAVSSARLAKLPRGLFKDVGATLAVQGPYDLGRALLAGRKLDRQRQAQLLGELERDLQAGGLTGAQLLEAQRALILTGRFDGAHAAALDAIALDLEPSLELALLYARLPGRLLGRKLTSPPTSVLAVPATGGRLRVTFSVRPQARVRGVFLCGSWDDWDEEATPMERQPDGTFRATLLLEAKTHQYKLRLTDGSWEIDATNPLSADDERGGLNSILPLD